MGGEFDHAALPTNVLELSLGVGLLRSSVAVRFHEVVSKPTLTP
jgi:hypothetical protein